MLLLGQCCLQHLFGRVCQQRACSERTAEAVCGCAQRQVMSLLGQYSPSLFQEVFALLHEVVEGFQVKDWSAVTVCAAP